MRVSPLPVLEVITWQFRFRVFNVNGRVDGWSRRVGLVLAELQRNSKIVADEPRWLNGEMLMCLTACDNI